MSRQAGLYLKLTFPTQPPAYALHPVHEGDVCGQRTGRDRPLFAVSPGMAGVGVSAASTPDGEHVIPYYADDAVTLWHGDCREPWGLGVVDLVLTDPPYGRNALPLWDRLATVATAALAPGGWLAAYSGQACLPEVFAALSVPALTYRWTLSARYEGGGQVASVGEMAVLSEWKPIVLYRRQPFGSARGPGGRFVAGGRDCLRDLLRRGGREKTFHPWAQPIGEASQLVGMLAGPGAVVLDPFAGSGTTLVAAKAHGCRAIGIEIEERYCEIAAKRLSQEVLDFGAPSA